MVWIPDPAHKGGGELVLVDSSPQPVSGGRAELISLNLSTGAHRTIGGSELQASSASSALSFVHLPGNSGWCTNRSVISGPS